MDKSTVEIEFGVESDDVCKLSPTSLHIPDMNTLHIEPDGDEFYIDINCKACGKSGCCGKYDAKEVAW